MCCLFGFVARLCLRSSVGVGCGAIFTLYFAFDVPLDWPGFACLLPEAFVRGVVRVWVLLGVGVAVRLTIVPAGVVPVRLFKLLLGALCGFGTVFGLSWSSFDIWLLCIGRVGSLSWRG